MVVFLADVPAALGTADGSFRIHNEVERFLVRFLEKPGRSFGDNGSVEHLLF